MRVYVARKSRLYGGHSATPMVFDREAVTVGEEGG